MMPVQKAPALCEAKLVIDETSYGTCHMELLPNGSCRRQSKHATDAEIGRIHTRWGWTQALSFIAWRIDEGDSLDDLLIGIDRDLSGMPSWGDAAEF